MVCTLSSLIHGLPYPPPPPQRRCSRSRTDPRNYVSNRCCSCYSRTTLGEALTWQNDPAPPVLPFLPVTGSGWGSWAPRGHLAISGNILMSQPDGGGGLGATCNWYVGRDQGCQQTSYCTQNSPTIIFYSKMPLVPWSRSPAVVLLGWCV